MKSVFRTICITDDDDDNNDNNNDNNNNNNNNNRAQQSIKGHPTVGLTSSCAQTEVNFHPASLKNGTNLQFQIFLSSYLQTDRRDFNKAKKQEKLWVNQFENY